MSVPVQTPVASFAANGITTVFPYAYLLLSSGDLQVTLDGVVLTSGFTISGVGSVTGGNVTFAVAPASGTLILRRKMSLSRLVDYVEAGDLLASTLNLDLDRIWMVMQGLQSDATRSIKLPEETLTDQTITDDAATRASKLLGFDVLGNVTTLDVFDPTALIVTTYIETLLSAANSVSARSILEAAADNDVVKLTGTQTVAGVKTFSDGVLLPTGTFTPTIESSGGGIPTYSIQLGRWTKVGDRYLITIDITLATLGTLAAGTVTIRSLPFTANSTTNNKQVLSLFATALAAGVTSPLMADIAEGTSSIRLWSFSAGSAAALTVSQLSGTSVLRLSGIVEV